MSRVTCAFRRADFFIGLSYHEGIWPPPLPPTPFYPHVSFGFVNGATQLFALPSCGHHKDIKANGLHLMGQMTDAFPIVPHVTTPTHIALWLTTLFGSSNMVWASSSVEMKCWASYAANDGTNANISTALAVVMAPHLACNDPLSFLFDLAFVTDSTLQVGMSLADFLNSLIQIAIQIAMEAALKILMCGAKAAYRCGRNTWKFGREGSKFVKFSEALEAVNAGRDADELLSKLKNGDEAIDDAYVKELTDASKLGKEAQESKVYKYSKLNKATLDSAEEEIEAQTKLKEGYKTQLKSKKISLSKYEQEIKNADQKIIKARFEAHSASGKLRDVDTTFSQEFWRLLKNNLTKADKDEFMTELQETATFRQYYKLGSDEPWYKVWKSVPDAIECWQAATRNSNKLYYRMWYPLARRFWGRAGSIVNSLYEALKDMNGGGDDAGTSSGSSGSSSASYNLFGWVDATVSSPTGTTTRFNWCPSLATSSDEQWADTSFNAATTDRFSWVSATSTTET